LLLRVRDVADAGAWAEFEERYRELIVRYARAKGLQPADADDVCQSVMVKLCQSLRSFAYDPGKGRFRSYLHRAVRNEVIEQFSRPKRLPNTVDHNDADMQAAGEDDADAQWEREWENHHFRLAMTTIRATFEPESVSVFERLLAGDSVDSVAVAFDTSAPAVHKIKQRIRNRMHALIARQIAEEDEPDRQIV
jgi:RNA polymerase sigma-70 factor (ECF subfamily)